MKPATVNALLFDLGGVVLEVDFGKVFEHMSVSNGLSVDHIKNRFSMDEAYQLHEKGLLSGTEYFAHLRNTLGLTADDKLMTASWNAIFGNQINSALDAIDKVRDRYPCYAFSNTNVVHQDYWDIKFPRIRKSFDHLFSSSEIGLRKPDAIAFQHIFKTTSIEAETMLFFDDSYENIEGAMQVGLQTVHVTSPAVVVETLDALP